jgi:hypothetical protein
MKVLSRNFNEKTGERTFSNRKLGMTVYIRIVMIMLFVNSKLCHIKNQVVKSKMFPHRNIYKYTSTSPDGKIHNQTDHILIDVRIHSSILDVRSFRAANCNTDHYLVASKVRERLAVSKQAALKFDLERFNLRKLNELEVRKQYQIKISNRLATLQNLNDSDET